MSVITANATSESEVLDGVHGQLFIGGEWIDGEQGTIDVELSEEFQLVPEQSTSAIVVHHPQAKYFSV